MFSLVSTSVTTRRQFTTTTHSHLRAKHPAEEQSMADFVTRQSKFDVRSAEQTATLILKTIAKTPIC